MGECGVGGFRGGVGGVNMNRFFQFFYPVSCPFQLLPQKRVENRRVCLVMLSIPSALRPHLLSGMCVRISVHVYVCVYVCARGCSHMSEVKKKKKEEAVECATEGAVQEQSYHIYE